MRILHMYKMKTMLHLQNKMCYRHMPYKYSELFPNNPYKMRLLHMYKMKTMLHLQNKMYYRHMPYKYNMFPTLHYNYIS